MTEKKQIEKLADDLNEKLKIAIDKKENVSILSKRLTAVNSITPILNNPKLEISFNKASFAPEFIEELEVALDADGLEINKTGNKVTTKRFGL